MIIFHVVCVFIVMFLSQEKILFFFYRSAQDDNVIQFELRIGETEITLNFNLGWFCRLLYVIEWASLTYIIELPYMSELPENKTPLFLADIIVKNGCLVSDVLHYITLYKIEINYFNQNWIGFVIIGRVKNYCIQWTFYSW